MMIRAILTSALLLNFGLIMGRISGFVRESFVASAYGVSSEADIVILMLTVPDLLVNILMGGALGAALIPEFQKKTSQQASSLLFQALLFFGCIFFLLALVLFWQSNTVVTLFAPGFDHSMNIKASSSIVWVIWLIPLTVLAGVTSSFLQSNNQFFTASLGTLIINIFIILGLVLVIFGYGDIYLLAVFVVIGGLVRLLSHLVTIEIDWNTFCNVKEVYITKELLFKYLQIMVSGSLLLFIPVVGRAYASMFGDGGLSLFNYSLRLIDFPLAIAITFLSTVLFPRLSDSYILKDNDLHNSLIKYGIQATVILSIITTILLLVLSRPYVNFVYGYGAMDNESLYEIQKLISIGLLYLPLHGLSAFLTVVFNSRGRTIIPLAINSAGVLVFWASYELAVFGTKIEAIYFCMIFSFAFVCTLQLFFLRVQELRFLTVFFEKYFLLGASVASFFAWVMTFFILRHIDSSIVSLVLAVFVGVLSLIIFVLCNHILKTRLLKIWG